ncbi:peptidase inhibitor 15-like [Centruroides sculpturatus]|uniref:peptidase inhibitor 15-like n=1 Tax=Centruroides sculpturatus TaxID=218467 RepID=UPI000C6DD585|nr:peptidase inhibitor 15-like [Centruroides sculpturatus]
MLKFRQAHTMIRSVLVLVLFEVMALDESCLVSSERNELANILQKDSSEKGKPIALSENDIKDILRRLNYFKRHPPYTSHKMIKLMWNNTLAKMAEEWGENCPHKRGPKNCLKFINQNIYRGNGKTVRSALTAWNIFWSYNYTGNYCFDEDYIGCLYYKALYWAESHSVGCAILTCRHDNLIICNFYPGSEKLDEELPFEVGKSDCYPELCPPQAQKCDTEDPVFSICEMTSVPEIPDEVINCALQLDPSTTLEPDTTSELYTTSEPDTTTHVQCCGYRNTPTVEKKIIIKLTCLLVVIITNTFYI